MKMKNKHIATTIIVGLLLFGNNSFAQEKVTLEKAIEIANNNNGTLKNEKLKADLQEKLIKTAILFESTSISGEYGQINSFYKDTKFGVSQTINLPTVYSKQKKMLTEEWKVAKLNVTLQEAELKKEVTTVFYTLLILKEKQKTAQQLDSVFSEFVKKATLRLEKGESNVLEKASAESQKGWISMQLAQIKQETELAQMQLQFLLNSEQNVQPEAKEVSLSFANEMAFFSEKHPVLQHILQQKKTNEAATKLEKAKLLPQITLGYNNNSFIGIGPNDVLYDTSTRFHSAQFGLNVPLFGGSQKAKINASKIATDVIENQYQIQKNQLEMELKNALYQYNSNVEKLNYFTKTALPNAKTIEKTATLQFSNGEINYLDWSFLMQQSSAIRNNYLEEVANQNAVIIQLQYLLTK